MFSKVRFKIFLFYLLSTSHCYEYNQENNFSNHSSQQSLLKPNRLYPYFDSTVFQNITGLVGKPAYLTCIVKNLGNETVSWIRHSDIHILTVGNYTFTSDQRFQASHHELNDEWILQIKWLEKRDSGRYECQISTQPIKSYFINLSVHDPGEKSGRNKTFDENYLGDKPFLNEDDTYSRMYSANAPTAVILKGPNIFLHEKNTINLTCLVRNSSNNPNSIYWKYNNRILNFDSEQMFNEESNVHSSYLVISNAKNENSGKYECIRSNTNTAVVYVHVLVEDYWVQNTATKPTFRNFMIFSFFVLSVNI